MLSTLKLEQFLLGVTGALVAEAMHWQRIVRRGRWPKYSRTVGYWFVTVLVVAIGGVVSAAISDAGTSRAQLLLLGAVGPQFLYAAMQGRASKSTEDLRFGSADGGVRGFLAS